MSLAPPGQSGASAGPGGACGRRFTVSSSSIEGLLVPPVEPCYPEPPWTYTNASIVNVLCRAEDPRLLEAFVPEGLRPQDASGTFSIFFLSVPRMAEMGPTYTLQECGLVLPVAAVDGTSGSCLSFMLVDNDQALAGGREIWGYPKKLGAVAVQRVDQVNLVAHASHLPSRTWSDGGVFRLQVQLDGSHDHLWEELGKLAPRLLVKQIRDPSTGRPAGSVAVRVDHEVLAVHERSSGTATVELGRSREEGLERIGRYDVLGALHQRCDFVLPYGSPLRAPGAPPSSPA